MIICKMFLCEGYEILSQTFLVQFCYFPFLKIKFCVILWIWWFILSTDGRAHCMNHEKNLNCITIHRGIMSDHPFKCKQETSDLMKYLFTSSAGKMPVETWQSLPEKITWFVIKLWWAKQYLRPISPYYDVTMISKYC